MKYVILFCLAFLFMTPHPVQEKNESQIHAAMIYNFMKYVNWPEYSSPDFVVAVYDNDDVYTLLHQWYNDKPKNNHIMKIIKVKSLNEIENAQVVYISKSKNREFDAIRALIRNKPILSITESENLGQRGSCINMKIIDDKLKFEINKKSFEESGLKVSSQLTVISIVI